MSRRRRRRRSRRRFSGVGFEGKKRSRRRGYRYGKRRGRSYRRYYGGEKTSPMNLIIKGAVAVGGGVAASMAAHYVPIKNPKLQAAVPIAIGALLTLLPMTRRNKIAQSAALGAVVVGALSLVRQMFPTVPLLTGDVYEGDQMYVPSYGEQQAMLGYPANMGDYEGEVVAEMGNLDGAEYEGDLDGVELM